MRLEIQAVGNPVFPRFIIANDQGEVYDGTAWNTDRKKAVLYANGQELAVQFRSLEEACHNHLPLREFAVTLNVTVRADQPFTEADLALYLERAACILLDHAKGTGPTENSLVQCSVSWDKLKEVVSQDGKKDQAS